MYTVALSPATLKRTHDDLVQSITDIDLQIAALQQQRITAETELNGVIVVLVNNGHASIDITAPVPKALEAPTAPSQQEPKDPFIPELPRYRKTWSTRLKCQWILAKYGPLTSRELTDKLYKHEPDANDKTFKNVSTILSQSVNAGKHVTKQAGINGAIYSLIEAHFNLDEF